MITILHIRNPNFELTEKGCLRYDKPVEPWVKSLFALCNFLQTDKDTDISLRRGNIPSSTSVFVRRNGHVLDVSSDVVFTPEGVAKFAFWLLQSIFPSESKLIQKAHNLNIRIHVITDETGGGLGEDWEWRVSIMPSGSIPSISIRLLNSIDIENEDFDSLYPVKKIATTLDRWFDIHEEGGLIVLSGPTGSGKSTTARTMLRRMQKRIGNDPGYEHQILNWNVVTIEDPIESFIPHSLQVQLDESVDFTFHAAFRSVLRQDPDLIFIGEVRSDESARVVFEASHTGHLCVTTIHAGSTALAIKRFQQLGIAPSQLANILRGVSNQNFVSKICPACTVPVVNLRVLQTIQDNSAGIFTYSEAFRNEADASATEAEGASPARRRDPSKVSALSINADCKVCQGTGTVRNLLTVSLFDGNPSGRKWLRTLDDRKVPFELIEAEFENLTKLTSHRVYHAELVMQGLVDVESYLQRYEPDLYQEEMERL